MKLSDALVKVVDNRGKTPPYDSSVNDYELIETASLVGNNKYPDYSRIGKWVSKETFDNWFRSGHPIKDDVMIATVGANIGSVAIMKETRGCVAQNLVAFRTNREILNPHYLYYYLSWDNTQRHLKNLDIGAAQPSIKVPHILDLEIPLPPIAAQRRIADILSAYDDLIENNTCRIRILEQMAQAIYQEWFGKVDKESLPDGWNSGIIRDFCESYNYGYTAKAQKGQDGIKYLRITDIVPDHIDWENVPSCEIDKDDIEKYLLREGDIVAARTGATTGYAKRLGKRHPKSIFASYLVRFRIQSEVSNRLIGLIVESDEYKKFIQANLGGAAQPMANAQVLTSFPLVIPPKELQKKFDFQVQPLFEQKEILQMKNANLRQTRDLLLPRLVSGEIDVSSLS